jgi:predicted metal-dependent peptidase
MVEFAPSTGGLALWVRHQDRSDAAGLPPVATDGNTLFYGASFEALPLPIQVGLVAHEVLHIALRHAQRFVELQHLVGDVDLALFNTCADAIVNSTLSHLSWLTLSPSAVSLDRLLASALDVQQSVETSLLEWNVERLYRAIDDRRQGGRRDGTRQHRQGSQGDGGEPSAQPQDERSSQGGSREDGPRAARVRALGADTHPDLLPGADARGALEEEAEVAREWSERILRGHAGDGAHSMLRALLADLPKTRTPWEQALRTQLTRSLSPRPSLSWSRPARSYIANQGRAGPHRRMPWEPGFSGLRAVPRLVLVVDVSGSIQDALLKRFALEIEAITRRQEAALVLIIGDDRVQRVEHFAPGLADLSELEFKGGGGTDFTPLLDEADRHRPDLVVVLTDLDGPARCRPRWPVIWAVPEAQGAAVPPFGRTLRLS